MIFKIYFKIYTLHVKIDSKFKIIARFYIL